MTYGGRGMRGMGADELDPYGLIFAPIPVAPATPAPLTHAPVPIEPVDVALSTLDTWAGRACANGAMLAFITYAGQYPGGNGPNVTSNLLVRAAMSSRPGILRTLAGKRSCTVSGCLRSADLAAIDLCFMGSCSPGNEWLQQALAHGFCPGVKRSVDADLDTDLKCADTAMAALQTYCHDHGFSGPSGPGNKRCFRYLTAGRLPELLALEPCGPGEASAPGSGAATYTRGPTAPEMTPATVTDRGLPTYDTPSPLVVDEAPPSRHGMSTAMMWGLGGAAALVAIGGYLIVKRSS